MGTHIRAIFLMVIGLLGVPAHAALQEIQSRHYTIYTDVGPALARQIATRMDAMHDELTARFADFNPDKTPPRGKLVVLASEADYQAATAMPNSGGVYIPKTDSVVTYLGDRGATSMFKTLQHEAFHQFSHQFIGVQLPVWLEEGLAEVFQEAVWTGESFLFGQVSSHRARRVMQQYRTNEFLSLQAMMDFTHEQWDALFVNADHVGMAYDQAWLMVHFLAFGTDGNGNVAYRQHFSHLLYLLHKGHTQQQAFAAAFNGNYAGFQARFDAWVPSLKPTPLGIYIEKQQMLGEIVLVLYRDNVYPRNLDDLREAMIHRQMAYILDNDTRLGPDYFLKGLDGKAILRNQLTFESTPQSTMPDLVYRYTPDVVLRTRFLGTPTDPDPVMTFEVVN